MIKPRLKSLLLVLLREANVIVTIVTAISILHLRSIHSIWFGLGTLVATATAKLLKKCIKQPRPTESNKKTYGMPSTHSSSITFFGIYLFLTCLLLPIHERITNLIPGGGMNTMTRSGDSSSESKIDYSKMNKDSFAASWREEGQTISMNDSTSTSFFNLLVRFFCGSMFILMAMTVCWSRIKLGHHTPKQVITGAMIGGMIGWIWFGIWTGFQVPKIFLLHHHHHHDYYSTTNNNNNQFNSNEKIISSSSSNLIKINGIGIYMETYLKNIKKTFIEAWYMRDFGIIWDTFIRPTINSIGFFFGLNHQIIDNGLDPNSHLADLKLHQK